MNNEYKYSLFIYLKFQSHLLDGVRRAVELDGVLHHAGELAGGCAEAGDVGLAPPAGAWGWQWRATLASTLTNEKTGYMLSDQSEAVPQVSPPQGLSGS